MFESKGDTDVETGETLTRSPRFLAIAGAAAIVAASIAFFVGLNLAAETAVKQDAVRRATAWAQFFGSQVHDLSARIKSRDFAEPVTVFKRAAETSDVFRFKLFNESGELIVVSDGPVPTNADKEMINHNAQALEVYLTGMPKTFVKEGYAKPDRPDIYAETYVPVLQNGRITGVVEVYVDQTATAAVIRAEYLRFGAFAGLLMLLALLIPVIGMARARKLAERNLELSRARDAAMQIKSDFLANMSHEIRTPMNGVLGMTELLAGTGLNAQQRMFSDTIMSSAKSLLAIINDVLDFSKISAGQIEISKSEFGPEKLFSEIAQMISVTVGDRDLELLLRIDPKLPSHVVGDAGRIRQIATNLLSNAVKFTDAGEVVMDVSSTGSSTPGELNLRIEVRDTGIGIPEDKLENVFGKFTQVDSSSTRVHEGTGLGLAISKGLVELMGGRVGVSSSLGVGSTFWVEIPLAASASAAPSAPIVQARGKRVLVIDDNATSRGIILERLEWWEMQGAGAASATEGVKAMNVAFDRGEAFDLIILDFDLPMAAGPEVLRVIREHPVMKATPVVGLSIVENLDAAASRGPRQLDATLLRPLSSSALLDQIMSLLAARAAADNRKTGDRETGSTSDEASSAGPTSILVVEDNQVNQMVAREMLKMMGFVPVIANNGEEGVRAWRAKRPSVVLMDVSMPVLSGYDATAAIRAAEAAEGLPRTHIIGMTAHAMEGDREACLDAGMDNFIPKPVTTEQVRKALVAAGFLAEEAPANVA